MYAQKSDVSGKDAWALVEFGAVLADGNPIPYLVLATAMAYFHGAMPEDLAKGMPKDEMKEMIQKAATDISKTAATVVDELLAQSSIGQELLKLRAQQLRAEAVPAVNV